MAVLNKHMQADSGKDQHAAHDRFWSVAFTAAANVNQFVQV